MKSMSSVVIGLVRDIDASLGRVKVSFPWLASEQDSNWAPIASLLAGKARGVRFMPEVDDEVLVAFEHGSFDHPYVIGFLWNGADAAPDSSQYNRIIVTPGGHELRFEDKDGDKRVVLKTKDGHVLALDDKDKSITLESKSHHKLEIKDQSGKVTLTTQSGGKVTLDNAPGRATIEAAPNKIVISPAGISIEAVSGPLSISSATATTITSTAAISVTTAAAMSIQSSAAMNIAAAGVVNLSTPALNVTAAIANFSGILRAPIVQADTIVASVYSPGVGNLI
ncbi:MAG: Rhs element Vgr protein [Betaproteobacteria bacterium]|nr:Rhs element Vgr protein [Betaproteobacteria bacterium]